MTNRVHLVVTSIAAPTPAMHELAAGARARGIPFVCVGDSKSPNVWQLDDCAFLSLEAQRTGAHELGRALPTGHYSRKNLGYLVAIAAGANWLVETDDDNRPLASFWDPLDTWVSGREIRRPGWVNAFSAFTDQVIWPRGLPLQLLDPACAAISDISTSNEGAICPVQQGLANGDSDVDAIYRMTRGNLVEFVDGSPLILRPGVWCPFNSQSTSWYSSAFDLLYLPSYCTFRMTDIWRSFVTQACLWANDWCVAFRSPTVHQDRNPHNLLSDFEGEVPGYLNNQRICERLGSLPLQRGQSQIRANMRLCYAAFVEMGLIAQAELALLEHWFAGVDQAQQASAS